MSITSSPVNIKLLYANMLFNLHYDATISKVSMNSKLTLFILLMHVTGLIVNHSLMHLFLFDFVIFNQNVTSCSSLC